MEQLLREPWSNQRRSKADCFSNHGSYSIPRCRARGQSIWALQYSFWSLQYCNFGIQTGPRAGAAVGDFVLVLHELAKHGLFNACSVNQKTLESVFLEVSTPQQASSRHMLTSLSQCSMDSPPSRPMTGDGSDPTSSRTYPAQSPRFSPIQN